VPRDIDMAPQRSGLGLLRLWHRWRRAVRERRVASKFTDRDLRDLGLTRGDLFHVLNGNRWWRVIR
jgi:uncharacterized protein YjiS (DUF1127 family)